MIGDDNLWLMMFDGLIKTAVLIYCTTNPTLDYLTTQDKSGLVLCIWKAW